MQWMPRFYFHIQRDGILILDPEGSPYPSLDTARVAAVEAIHELVADRIRCGKQIGADEMKICDEAGTVLEIVSFHAVVEALLRR